MTLVHITSLIGAVAALVAACGTALNYRSLARAREAAAHAAGLAHENNRLAQAQGDRLEKAINGGLPPSRVDS
jgi:hypothetical protein